MLFPFDSIAFVCPQCSTVIHRFDFYLSVLRIYDSWRQNAHFMLLILKHYNTVDWLTSKLAQYPRRVHRSVLCKPSASQCSIIGIVYTLRLTVQCLDRFMDVWDTMQRSSLYLLGEI